MWARQNSGRVRGYPTIEPFERLRGSTVPEPLVTDSQAMYVDALVADLSLAYPREAEALALTHVDGLPLTKVAARLRCARTRSHELLRAATMWIEGRMAADPPTWMD